MRPLRTRPRPLVPLVVVVTLLAVPHVTRDATAQAPRQQPQCESSSSATHIDECIRARVDSVSADLRNATGRVLELLPDSARRAFLMTDAKWVEYQRGECRSMGAQVFGMNVGARVHIECMALLASNRALTLRTIYNFGMANPANFGKPDADPHGGCVGYEPDTVEVTGVLVRQTYPGPPNYENIARGDARETGYYLNLSQPLCVSRNLDATNVPTAGVRRLQLILDGAAHDRLRPKLNKRLTLRGTLAHAFTAHHRAELLLTQMGGR